MAAGCALLAAATAKNRIRVAMITLSTLWTWLHTIILRAEASALTDIRMHLSKYWLCDLSKVQTSLQNVTLRFGLTFNGLSWLGRTSRLRIRGRAAQIQTNQHECHSARVLPTICLCLLTERASRSSNPRNNPSGHTGDVRI